MMMTETVDLVKSTQKAGDKSNTTNTSQKHSAPFYISTSLFNNKRLKQRRCKWAEQWLALERRKRKTDLRRRKLSSLQADVTINLLSDDETTIKASNMHHGSIYCGNQDNHMQHLVLYPNVDLTEMANAALLPMQNMALQNLAIKGNKCIRKSQQPKRHSQPVITESIVLTDDSDTEDLPKATTSPRIEHIRTSTPVEPQLPKTPPPTYSAQVDEEVTVSIVPRSSATGSCPKVKPNEVFPMLPDETTVHTVIANRIYELSLSKLREGLASCGIPEFVNGQQKPAPIRRKVAINPPPLIIQPQQPIALKLSSDLSISLISDDEDEQQLPSTPNKLLQQQPQLSVQHFQATATATAIPRTIATATATATAATATPTATAAAATTATASCTSNARPVPRRRKLG